MLSSNGQYHFGESGKPFVSEVENGPLFFSSEPASVRTWRNQNWRYQTNAVLMQAVARSEGPYVQEDNKSEKINLSYKQMTFVMDTTTEPIAASTTIVVSTPASASTPAISINTQTEGECTTVAVVDCPAFNTRSKRRLEKHGSL